MYLVSTVEIQCVFHGDAIRITYFIQIIII